MDNFEWRLILPFPISIHILSTMHDQYMRTGEGFMVVFDVSNGKSYQEVDNYRERISRVKDKDKVSLIWDFDYHHIIH